MTDIPIEPSREFPTIDLTQFVIRTKNAPLTSSGCYEVVAAFEHKSDALIFARAKFGKHWRGAYEVLPKGVLLS